MIRPTIKTAPSEAVFEELDLTDKASTRWLRSIDSDIKTFSFVHHLTRTKRAMQRVISFDCQGLTVADFLQIEKWEKNRTLVRPYANYGANTIFYQAFQRANTKSGDLGAPQIGPPEAAFTEPWVTATAGNTTFLGDDAKLHQVALNVPRFEKGPFGMNGLMVEGRVYQHFPKSHPLIADVIWAQKTGSPTIAGVDDIESILDGTTEVGRGQFANTEAINVFVGGSGDLNADTGLHSFQLYVKGQGTVELEVYFVAAQLATTGNVVLTGQWQRLTLENFTKAAVGAYEFRLTCKNTEGALVYLGPMMINDENYVNRYIHNLHGTNFVRKDNVKNEWAAPFRLPDNLCSAYLAFKHPRATGGARNQWVCHQENSSPTRWGFRYKGVGKNWLFQKAASPATEVTYGTSKVEDDDTIITGTYDLDEINIYEDGVFKATKALTAIHTLKDGFNLGDPEINRASISKPLAFIRIDAEIHDAAKVKQICDQYIDVEQRPWHVLCEGRNFEIAQNGLRTVQGNADQYEGRLVLVEVFSYESQTIEAP